jgi:tetratricopeptide (TPR) repeat protein
MKTRLTTKTFIRLIFFRVAGLYLLFALLFLIFVDGDAILHYARGTTLSRIIPDFAPLIAFNDQGKKIDPEKWYTYINYYQQVWKFQPDRSDVAGLLGYCFFYSGDVVKSEQYLRKALQEEPAVCSFNYNLGLIYYKKGDYQKALEFFRKALDADVIHDMNYVTSSRVFFPLLKNVDEVAGEITEKLRLGYKKALMLSIICCQHLKDYSTMSSLAKTAIKTYVFDDDFFNFYSGVASYQLGLKLEAIYFFREVIKTRPELADSYYYLGLLMQETGQNAYVDPMQKQYLFLKNNPQNTVSSLEERCQILGMQLY